MSLRRNTKLENRTAGELKLCQICQKPAIISGKWCSEEHKEEFRQRNSESYSRLKVFERDRGVCIECALDCHRVSIVRDKANRNWKQFNHIEGKPFGYKRGYAGCRKLQERYVKVWVSMILRLGIPQHLWLSGALWHADHILPVFRGGGETTISNRVTSCWRCHGEKTSLEAKGRKLLGKHKLDDYLSGLKT